MSWYQLLDVYKSAPDIIALGLEGEKWACPNDGEPLIQGPGGEWLCRFDGWRPNGINAPTD